MKSLTAKADGIKEKTQK